MVAFGEPAASRHGRWVTASTVLSAVPIVLEPTPRPSGPAIRRLDLISAGYSAQEIRRFVRDGRLVRLRRGYFAVRDPAGTSTADQHRLRAIAAADASTCLVLSHVSAAVLHGLWLHDVDLTEVHLTRPGHGGGRVHPGQRVHTGQLDLADVVTLAGCRVTSLARTVVDLARTLPYTSAVVVADAALRCEACDPAAVVRCMIAATAARGHPAARRALAVADGRSESVGETRTRLALLAAGFPPPELQPEIYDENGRFVGRPDLAYVQAGVLIEFDGKIKYQRALIGDADVTEVILREKRREERLAELGWLTIRVTWSDLADPAALAARISRAIAARRRLVAAGGIRGRIVCRSPRRLVLP
jgi:hypothetical protein